MVMRLELQDAINRVRELHTEGVLPIMGEEHHLCVNCMHKYPCPTIKALDGEQ